MIFKERHLRRVLSWYVNYYHRTGSHLSLEKDSAEPRPVMPPHKGRVLAIPQVNGLHHRYERLAASFVPSPARHIVCVSPAHRRLRNLSPEVFDLEPGSTRSGSTRRPFLFRASIRHQSLPLLELSFRLNFRQGQSYGIALVQGVLHSRRSLPLTSENPANGLSGVTHELLREIGELLTFIEERRRHYLLGILALCRIRLVLDASRCATDVQRCRTPPKLSSLRFSAPQLAHFIFKHSTHQAGPWRRSSQRYRTPL